MLRTFILCFTILFQVPDVFNAKVIGITDGYTIVILTSDNQQVKIRLEGIDCPEMKQDFGTRAKQAASELCYGKQVSIHKSGVDRYGRTLAYVYVGDTCINKELLRLGMAWHFKKYNRDKELAQLEIQAREKKVGLWSQLDPITPWDWRKKYYNIWAFPCRVATLRVSLSLRNPRTGIYCHRNIKPIKIKKHGRKAFSYLKYGLVFIAHALLSGIMQDVDVAIKILSCT